MSETEVPRYLPILVAVTSAIVGAIGGAALGWMAATPEPVAPTTVEVPRDYTEEELRIACLPYMRQTATSLEEVETRVQALEVQVRAKEAEVAELERQVSEGSRDEAALRGQLQGARQQLSTLETQLGEAEAEKERLLAELAETKEALSVTRTRLVSEQARTQMAEEDALRTRWEGFVADSMLTVCEKGSKTKLERCREIVGGRLVEHERRFKSCVRSGQAVPRLDFVAGDALPRQAVWLAEDDKALKGWYVEFCDPELPEAGRPEVVPPP